MYVCACTCVCASACVCACVCVLVYMCISPRSMCIRKGGVNLLYMCFSCPEVASYRSFMCANICVFVISNTHTNTQTLVNVHDDSAPYFFCGRAQMWF